MLKLMRKNTKVIIWAVVLSFVLWGGYSVGTMLPKKARYAGEVFGKGVSFQEFKIFENLTAIFLSTEEIRQDPQLLRQQIWFHLVLAKEAQRRKIEVTDDEVREEIRKILAAQNIQNPTPELYGRWVRSVFKLNPDSFETQLREVLRIEKLKAGILNGPAPKPSPEDARRAFFLEQNKIAAEATVFPSQDKAAAFRSKVQNDGAAWKRETEGRTSVPEPGTLSSLSDFARTWELPLEKAEALGQAPVGSISEILPSRDQFVVFRITENQKVPESSFDAKAQTEYLDKLTKLDTRNRMLIWSLDLMRRAKVMDYASESSA